MNHSSTNLVYMALGAVLIALCSWITVPAAVPFTMQTFAVFFILSALGGKRGTVTILVYIALGAAGVPVFSQFGAGPGVLLGNTGGYILGFLAMGLTYWGITALLGETRKIRFLGLLLAGLSFMPLAPPGSFFFTPGLRKVWGSFRFLAGASSPL